MNNHQIKLVPLIQHTPKRRVSYKRFKKLTFKKLLVPSIIFFVILLFVCILGLFNANASEDKASQQVKKHYSSIIIQPKDNLWGIAEKYVQYESISSYVDNVKKLNNMNEDTIYAGKSIIVYYYEWSYKFKSNTKRYLDIWSYATDSLPFAP